MSDEHDAVERLDRSWNDNASAWTATVRERRIASRRAGTDRAIVETVRRIAPARILDVGCGEGWLCRELHGAGRKTVGIDGSRALIEAARAADPAGDYHALPYAELHRLRDITDPPFDAAVCNFSLLHETIEPVLAAIGATLRPHGALLIQTVHPWVACGDAPYQDGWRTEDFAWSELPFPEPMPWYFRTLESWTRALVTAGFVIDALSEPLDPDTGKPLSLLISAHLGAPDTAAG